MSEVENHKSHSQCWNVAGSAGPQDKRYQDENSTGEFENVTPVNIEFDDQGRPVTLRIN